MSHHRLLRKSDHVLEVVGLGRIRLIIAVVENDGAPAHRRLAEVQLLWPLNLAIGRLEVDHIPLCEVHVLLLMLLVFQAHW